MSGRLTSYSHDGLAFDVLDEGPIDGDAVVLLHGFPERASSWRDVAPRLHAAGFRTFAPDQRGYSPGARPRRRRDYRISKLVGDVAALIDRVGRPVHLVGHDWGAIVGWSVAAARPDLVRTWTAVSVPHPLAFILSWFTSPQLLRSWYMLAFQLPWLPERRVGDFPGALRRGGMTEEEVRRFEREILDYGAFRGALMWYRAMFFPDRRPWSRRIRVPTTFVSGDQDIAVGPWPERYHRRFVDAPYSHVRLEGVSHWVPTQAPDRLADLILARVRSV